MIFLQTDSSISHENSQFSAEKDTKVSIRATSHLSMRLTAMHVTVNEVSSHSCKILTLIVVKTYLQTGRDATASLDA